MKATWSRQRGMFALLLVAVALMVTGISPAGRVSAQDGPLGPEDEAWVVATAEELCREANASDNDNEDCEGPEEALGSLRACLQTTLPELHGAAREVCRSYVRNAGSTGLRSAFERNEILRSRTDTVLAEAALLASLGIDRATIEAVTAALSPCVLEMQISGALASLQDYCSGAYEPAKSVWQEAAVQRFEASLTPLLDQGYSAGDLLRGVEAFRACLQDALSTQPFSPEIGKESSRCEFAARAEAGLGRPDQGAPAVADVTCSPNPALAGDLVSCSATLTGPVTGVQWSAPGGSPNALSETPAAGSESGRTVQFTTSFNTSGSKSIEVTACNRPAGTDRDLCASGRTTVEVTAVAPVIDGMSCTSGPVNSGDVVNCSASVSGNSASATNRWSAPGGDPSDGRGLSFSTQYSGSGSFTIRFRSCAGPDPLEGQGGDPRACSERTASVTVRDGTPKVTSIGCSPASVPVNTAVTCTPQVDGTVTSRTWTAAGGTPATGAGPTFSTRFASPGAKQITLEVCNGGACSTALQPVTVTGEVKCTQWNVSGTWHTSQGNGYNPTFVFQQSGTSISGTATLPGAEASRAGFRSPSGPVSGTLHGDQLVVNVTWNGNNGPVTGRYTATVIQGRLSNGNAGGQSWNGAGPTQCTAQG